MWPGYRDDRLSTGRTGDRAHVATASPLAEHHGVIAASWLTQHYVSCRNFEASSVRERTPSLR